MIDRARSLGVAGAAVLVLAGSLTATAATPSVRWVDDDGRAGGAGCDATTAASTTVQGAVTASGPGDTVIVCPGTYEEQVRIRGGRDGLKLRGATPWSATLLGPSSLARPLGFGYLVLIEQVDGVTIQGLRFRARSSGECDRLDVFVAALASVGSTVRGNRMAATGDPAGPCGFGIGVAESDSLHPAIEHPVSDGPSSLFAAYNLVEGFRQAGIGAFSSGRSIRLTTVSNSLRFVDGTRDGAQAGVMAFGRVTGSIARNFVRGPLSSKGPRLFAGVFLSGQDSSEHGPSMVVEANRLERAEVGVGVQRGDGSVVRRNIIRFTTTAVQLSDSHGVLVARNDAAGEAQAVHVDGDATDNILRGNTFSGSCTDASTGTGTAGTANIWTGDSGATSDPVGICAVP